MGSPRTASFAVALALATFGPATFAAPALAAEAYVIIHHKVSDYDTWRAAYDAHGEVRAKYNQSSDIVMRGADDPSQVSVLIGFPSLEDAKAFAADPGLPEAMKAAGVEGQPDIRFANGVD